MAVLLVGLVACLLGATTAQAEIAPPWCGTPEPDAAENLPDGTDPADPAGSFPHIPYYAIGCTLESLVDQSDGRMTLEKSGESALGRDMYVVTVNALDTRARRRSYARLQRVAGLYARNPRRAQRLIERRDAKVPLFIQSGIHGNEYEGVDASMRFIERLATTPYGTDPEVDAILDHAVIAFHVVQNPDGRIAGTRTNGNGFDLNRDYITQSQPETMASVDIIKRFPFIQTLDLHGYATPTLLEGTTVPHNPGIEYDIWLKWNQPRLGRQPGAAGERGLRDQPPGEQHPGRVDPHGAPGRDVAPGLGRLGPLLHGPVRPAARTGRLDDRDVLGGRRQLRDQRGGAAGGRPRRRAALSGVERVLLGRLRDREPPRDDVRSVRDLSPGCGRRRAREADRPGAGGRHRRGSRLHDRLPARARDPGGQPAAQRSGGEAAGRLPPGERHRGQPAAAGLPPWRPGLREGLVRRADEPGPARSRQHHPGRGRRHLRPRDPAVCAAGSVEQRLPVGRRRGHHRQGPSVLAGDQARPQHGPGRRRGPPRPIGLVRA